MSEFSAGDWIFIAGVMVVIVVCIAISDLRMKK
jgi:hypothetical protein